MLLCFQKQNDQWAVITAVQVLAVMDVRLHARVFVQDVQLLVTLQIVIILVIVAAILHAAELVTELVLEDVVVIPDTINL